VKLKDILSKIRALAAPAKAASSQRFFKTSYGAFE
jgi:hypothetical protein